MNGGFVWFHIRKYKSAIGFDFRPAGEYLLFSQTQRDSSYGNGYQRFYQRDKNVGCLAKGQNPIL
jgi:hypothetical protein